MCQRRFFNKVVGLRPATLLRKSPWHRCFPVNFVKFLRVPNLQNTSGRLLLYINLLRCKKSSTKMPLKQLKERLRVNEATYAFPLNFFYLSFRSETFSMHPLFYPCFKQFLCLCNDSFFVFYKFLYREFLAWRMMSVSPLQML